MNAHVLIVGDEVVGPFASRSEAEDWADTYLSADVSRRVGSFTTIGEYLAELGESESSDG